MNTRAIIRLNLRLFSGNLRLIAFLLAAIVLFCILGGAGMVVLLPLFVTLTTMDLFVADSLLYMTLPIDRRGAVLGRYLFIWSIILLTSAATYAVAFAVGLFVPRIHLALDRTALELTASLAINLLIVAIQFPLLYRFGNGSGRLLGLLPTVLLLALAMPIMGAVTGDSAWAAILIAHRWLTARAPLAWLLAALSTLAVSGASLALSMRIHTRQDL